MPEVKLARIPVVREIPGRAATPFAERHDVLFVGGFLHPPNVDAVRYFVNEVWPLVRQRELDRPCRFIIAGSNTPPEIQELARPDVIVKGFVTNLEDLFDTALISIAPLRYGAGLKGKVRVNSAGCIDQCERGVSIVVYPEAVWYGNVTLDDVDELFHEHLLSGRPVERLRTDR